MGLLAANTNICANLQTALLTHSSRVIDNIDSNNCAIVFKGCLYLIGRCLGRVHCNVSAYNDTAFTKNQKKYVYTGKEKSDI